MNFVTHFLRSSRGQDVICVIVVYLAKNAHFLPISMKMLMEKLTRFYIS